MSLNVVSEYVEFTKNQFQVSTKKIMGKYYDKELFLQYMDMYVNVRYYNQMVLVRSSLEANLNYYLEEVYSKNESKVSKFMLELFKMYYYIDDVKKFDYDKNLKDYVQEIVDIRENKVGIVDKDFKNDYKKFLLSMRDRRLKFIDSLDSKDFSLQLNDIEDNRYMVSLETSVSIPKLYSNYAIRKVWNSPVISENAFQIELYLLSQVILRDVIKGNFLDYYLVDFVVSLFSKKEKLRRVISIFNNDVCLEYISFNISYHDFLENKDSVLKLIHDGVHFNVVLDDDFMKDKNYDMLDIFRYIIILDNKYKSSRFVGKKNVILM